MGLVAAGCGRLEELGGGVCMGTQPQDAIAVTGAEHLAVNQAMPVPGAGRPIYVARDSQGFMAVDATCTHMDCEAVFVSASGDYECGCHGSRFGLDGAVLRGPAQRPLAHVYLCRDTAGQIIIQPERTLSSNSGRIQ